MRYQVVIEHGPENLSAYVPDLPGCIVTGKSVEQIRDRMSKAIAMHVRGMIEDGIPLPTPGTHVLTVSLPVQELRQAIARKQRLAVGPAKLLARNVKTKRTISRND